MAGVHARRAPSHADCWAVCAGALNATAGMPDRRTPEAALGTVCHHITNLCLDHGLEPWDFLGQIHGADGFYFMITEERCYWMERALSVVRDLPGQRWTELRVSLEKWLPGDFGTLDVGLVIPELITIIDFKFGMVRVNAEWNKQLLLYALGFWWDVARHITKATRFRIISAQPRIAGGISEFYIDLDDLLKFGEEMRAAGERTLDPNAPKTASDRGCYKCDLNPERGGPGCNAITELMLRVIQQRPEDVEDFNTLGAPPTLPAPADLDRETVAFIVAHDKMFERWLKAVREQELARGVDGDPPPGMKVIDGDQGDRKWADEQAAESALIEVLYARAFNKKLKSPAQAEKELKPTRTKPGNPEAWERLQALIVRDESKPLLVPVADGRPERKPVDSKFEET